MKREEPMNSLRSTRLWLVGGYACLLATAVLGFRGVRARPQSEPVQPSVLSSAARAITPAVAVVFRLEDCSGSIDRLAAWNELAERGEARVYGFVLDAAGQDAAAIRKALEGSGLRFAISPAPKGYFEQVIATDGFARTPLALVYDQAGRVRMVVPLEGRSGAEDVRSAAPLITQLAHRQR
jgi:hypothetical protein